MRKIIIIPAEYRNALLYVIMQLKHLIFFFFWPWSNSERLPEHQYAVMFLLPQQLHRQEH